MSPSTLKAAESSATAAEKSRPRFALARHKLRSPVTPRFPVVLFIALASAATPYGQFDAVSLRVVDRDSRIPILRARVAAASTQSLAPTFTDGQGRVSIGVSRVGRTLRISKPGYVSQTIEVSAASEPVQVRLSRGAAISGRVIDTVGASVVGRTVVLTSIDSTVPPRAAVTNDVGEYRVGALAEGTYSVSLGETVARAPIASANEVRESLERAKAAAGADGPAPSAARDALPHTVVVRRGEEVGGIDFSVPPRSSCRPVDFTPPLARFFNAPRVSGRVTTFDGAPLPCVEVAAYRAGNRTSTAVTDSDGRYSLERLPAGTVTVEFRRTGFVSLQWGQTQISQPGRALVLREGDNVTRIDIALTRGGAITGTIVDEFGEPEENIAVRALHLRGEDERAIAIDAGTVQTDDRGRYRFFGLLPGRYIVGTKATSELADAGTGRGYPPAYFPGTVEIASASQIDVNDSQERQWTDFARVPTRVATITGVALNSKTDPVTDRVILVASQRSGAVIAETQGADVNTINGMFTIPNVAPGDYVLQATSKRGEDEPPEFGRQYVTVVEADPLPLRVQTAPGIDLRGRLIEDGVPGVDPRQFGIMAVPVDWDQTSLLSGTEMLTVDGEGILSLRGVTGPRRFVLMSSPFNWSLKSVTVRGLDVTDEVTGFPIAGLGFIRDLQVVVSNKGATIEGDATDGTAVNADYSVILFSTNPDHWFRHSRFLKTARSNTTGKFRIEGVTDGDYYLLATDPLNGSAASTWQQRDFLISLMTYARRISVRGGEGRSLSLSVTHR
jgi:hypothetical protein